MHAKKECKVPDDMKGSFTAEAVCSRVSKHADRREAGQMKLLLLNLITFIPAEFWKRYLPGMKDVKMEEYKDGRM